MPWMRKIGDGSQSVKFPLLQMFPSRSAVYCVICGLGPVWFLDMSVVRLAGQRSILTFTRIRLVAISNPLTIATKC